MGWVDFKTWCVVNPSSLKTHLDSSCSKAGRVHFGISGVNEFDIGLIRPNMIEIWPRQIPTRTHWCDWIVDRYVTEIFSCWAHLPTLQIYYNKCWNTAMARYLIWKMCFNHRRGTYLPYKQNSISRIWTSLMTAQGGAASAIEWGRVDNSALTEFSIK